jgi:hypothetical protein
MNAASLDRHIAATRAELKALTRAQRKHRRSDLRLYEQPPAFYAAADTLYIVMAELDALEELSEHTQKGSR